MRPLDTAAVGQDQHRTRRHATAPARPPAGPRRAGSAPAAGPRPVPDRPSPRSGPPRHGHPAAEAGKRVRHLQADRGRRPGSADGPALRPDRTANRWSRYGSWSSPAIGGTAARLPAAMTKRLAVMLRPSTDRVAGSRKRASPRSTVAPRARKRASESTGAISAMTPCTAARTLSQSIAGSVCDDAEPGGVADRAGGMRGREQRLARHAAAVEAVAAHAAALDQRHPGAELRRAGRDRQPGGARADDGEVKVRRQSRIRRYRVEPADHRRLRHRVCNAERNTQPAAAAPVHARTDAVPKASKAWRRGIAGNAAEARSPTIPPARTLRPALRILRRIADRPPPPAPPAPMSVQPCDPPPGAQPGTRHTSAAARRRSSTGSSDIAARPSSGSRIRGPNSTDRSGVRPCARTPPTSGADGTQDEAHRHDAHQRGRDEHGQPESRHRGGKIDDPERHQRHQPQRQQVAEPVARQARLKLRGNPRAMPLQRPAEGGPDGRAAGCSRRWWRR